MKISGRNHIIFLLLSYVCRDLQMMLKSVVILHVVDISRCTYLNEVINLNELDA